MTRLIITETQFNKLEGLLSELYGEKHRDSQPENDEDLNMAFLHKVFKPAKVGDGIRIRHIGDKEEEHHGAYKFEVAKKTKQFLYLTSEIGQFKDKYFFLRSQPFNNEGALENASRPINYTTKKGESKKALNAIMQAINSSNEAQESIRYFYNWHANGDDEQKKRAKAFFMNPKKYQVTAYKGIDPSTNPELLKQSNTIKNHILPITDEHGTANFKKAAFQFLRVPINEELLHEAERFPYGSKEQTFERVRDIQLFRGGKPIGEVVVDNTLDIHMEKTKEELRNMSSEEVMKVIESDPILKNLFYKAPSVLDALRNKDPKTLATVHKILGKFYDKRGSETSGGGWLSFFRKDQGDLYDLKLLGREGIKSKEPEYKGYRVMKKTPSKTDIKKQYAILVKAGKNIDDEGNQLRNVMIKINEPISVGENTYKGEIKIESEMWVPRSFEVTYSGENK